MTAEELAFNLAGLTVELTAIVEWCVERDGECLGDNPKQLAYAKRIIAKSRALLILPPARVD